MTKLKLTGYAIIFLRKAVIFREKNTCSNIYHHLLVICTQLGVCVCVLLTFVWYKTVIVLLVQTVGEHFFGFWVGQFLTKTEKGVCKFSSHHLAVLFFVVQFQTFQEVFEGALFLVFFHLTVDGQEFFYLQFLFT